jgi:hypothetical protein
MGQSIVSQSVSWKQPPAGTLDHMLAARGFRVKHDRGGAVLRQTNSSTFTSKLQSSWKLKLFLEFGEVTKEFDVADVVCFKLVKTNLDQVLAVIRDSSSSYLAAIGRPTRDAASAPPGPEALTGDRAEVTRVFMADLKDFVSKQRMAGNAKDLIAQAIDSFVAEMQVLLNKTAQMSFTYGQDQIHQGFLDTVEDAIQQYNVIRLHIAQQDWDLFIRADNASTNVKLELGTAVSVSSPSGAISATLSVVSDSSSQVVAQEVNAEPVRNSEAAAGK